VYDNFSFSVLAYVKWKSCDIFDKLKNKLFKIEDELTNLNEQNFMQNQFKFE